MRREPQTQWRYLRNASPDHLEVHDLDNEKTGANQCQINEIIRAKNAYYVKINGDETSLLAWLRQNPSYDGCKYCLQHLHRK